MRRRRQRLSGSGFFMFLLVMLPFTLLGVALAADYSRALLAKRQAGNVADTVAMAAATSFAEGSQLTELDPRQAEERAKDMFAQAVATGMLPKSLEASLTAVQVSSDRRNVSVTLKFSVPELFVVRAIAPGAETQLSGQVTRQARVCIPEETSDPGCAYPVG